MSGAEAAVVAGKSAVEVAYSFTIGFPAQVTLQAGDLDGAGLFNDVCVSRHTINVRLNNGIAKKFQAPCGGHKRAGVNALVIENTGKCLEQVFAMPHTRAAEISRASRELALDKGLSAITLRNVAARVGVASGLVAHYEPNVEALVAATFRAIVAAETGEVSRRMTALQGPTERLVFLLQTLMDGSRLDVTAIWVEAWTLGRRNEALAGSVREQMDSWQEVVRTVVEEGIDRGHFTTSEPEALAWQILGMIDGLNAQSLVRWEGVNDRGAHLLRAIEGMLGASRGALTALGAQAG